MTAPASSFAELVGREDELALLRAQLDQACAGAGSVALLAGEPGIGKTRTAEELAADARLRGARVLWGRCYEGEGAPAFWPWVQLIRGYLHDQHPDLLRAELGPGTPEIAELVPELRQRLPEVPAPAPLEPAQARFRLFESITAFFVNAAARQPAVLILDDLHWADRPSLLLLQFLARELRRTRLLVIGTYRDVELGRRHPLTQTLAELARDQAGQRIQLRGLSGREIARFIELTAGLDPPDALVAAVADRTEGNPFFVAEIVRLLLTEGRLERPEQAGSGAVAIPRSVRDVIGRRLERFSERCQRLLTVAAVIGRDFSLASLARTSGLSAQALLETLEEAEAGRVIAPLPRALGRYSFSHALIRETLYEELPAARRAKLHDRVGQALEALSAHDPEPHLADLAHHFLQGAPAGDPARAVHYARRAGERALRLLAYEEAASLYEHALQALELQSCQDGDQRCELLLALGDARRKAGEPRRAMDAFQRAAELAKQLEQPGLLASAALGFEDAVLPAGIARAGAADPSILLLEAALTALGEAQIAVKARVLAALARAHCFSGAPARAALLSEEAVELARRVGDQSALVYALNARRIAIWGPDRPEERLAVASEIVRRAAEIGDLEMALEGHQWRWHVLVELGQLAPADAEVEAYARLAERLRQPLHRSYLPLLSASRALLDGRFADAERQLDQALIAAERVRSQNIATVRLAQLLCLRREQGRSAELEPAFRDYADQYPAAITWRCVLALLAGEQGRQDEARRRFEELAARSFADLPRSHVWLLNLAFLAELCSLLSDAGRAAPLYQLLLPYAARNVLGTSAGPCWGSAARHLGLLAATMRRWDEAAGHFQLALQAHAWIGARPWLARTQYDFACLLLARGRTGDRQQAAGLLAEALAAARELGMTRLADQIERLPVGRRGSEAGSLPSGLTAREAEVLRRIAAGRTNRQIAEELVLSVRTVEHHVANLYAKIGARGRAEATAYALRRGLAPASPPG